MTNLWILSVALLGLCNILHSWVITQYGRRIRELEQFQDALINSITKAIEEENDGTEE